MLSLQVDYLMGKVYSGDFRDRSATEWPPHPARLFAALTSACFETEAGDQAVNALAWLEKQGPPQIAAGRSGSAVPYTCFVPTNYVDKHGLHTKQPRFFPAQAPEVPTVHFIWPQATPTQDLLSVLDSLAARVAYLGKSASLVRIRIVDQPPAPSYIPSASGEFVFRVPAEGRLDELRRMFQANRWDPQATQQRYTAHTPIDAPQGRSSSFGDPVIFARVEGPPLPAEATLTVTEALRKSLLAIAGRDGIIPEILHGHTSSLHVAFAALPFAGYPHADGRILGCGILVPRECAPGDRRAILRAIGKLNVVTLAPELGRWVLEEVLNPDDAARSLRANTWTQAARVWKSVTPVLLDRFPKKRIPAEEIIADSCERGGLPRPISVDHGPYSDLEGVPPVPAFRLLRTTGDSPKWGVHVSIRFAEPVRGPVLIGAGRFFGLGLLRPADPQEALA